MSTIDQATMPRMRGAGLFGGPPGDPGAPGAWKRLLFPGIWLFYLAQTASGVTAHSRGAAAVVGYLILPVFAACYLGAIAAGRRSPRLHWTLFGTMLALTVAEAFFAHEDAFVMCVYLAVLIMASLLFCGKERYAALAIAGLTLVVVVAPALIPAWDTGPDWGMLVTLPIVALAMFGFFTIIRSNRELSDARSEVARLAAENERTRIARDLHDLLGHSLTTITVKAGLAHRLAERDPVRAAREIGEVEELSRDALADVRATVAGYREVTLEGEVATAHEVLRAAGIEARTPSTLECVAPAYTELFGWVVREAVTNVVRHSRARTCVIAAGPSWVEIDDDGAGGASTAGNGLTGLRERVAAAGGVVRAGGGDHGWSLRVEMPA